MDLKEPKTLTSQTFTDDKGITRISGWYEDPADLVDYVAEYGGTINSTYQRCGGEMWEVVAGEKLLL